MKTTILILIGSLFLITTSCKKEYITYQEDIYNNYSTDETKQSIQDKFWYDSLYSINLPLFNFKSNNNIEISGDHIGYWNLNPNKTKIIIDYDSTLNDYIQLKGVNALPYHCNQLRLNNKTRDIIEINYYSNSTKTLDVYSVELYESYKLQSN